MDYSEKWGTDVDTAVKLALDDLGLTIDEVNVTVLEEASKGFFGIGQKLALVRVEKKEQKKAAPVKEEIKKAPVKENKKKEPEIKKEKQEVIEEPVILTKRENLKPVEDHEALTFLKDVSEKMGLTLDITASSDDECLYIDIEGKDSGTIIGKRGQTLDAIQYLTNLVANKNHESGYVRVVVDAENYRVKREKTLEALAVRLANKAIKTKRNVRLEPMNPYERKVIHATLQNNPYVTTRSEGQDPYRRVIIELK